MRQKRTTVATFNDLEKAQGVRNCLAAAGVAAEVHDESSLQKYWFLSKPLAAYKVVVGEKDLGSALLVLQIADSHHHILQGEVRCPQCGSANVEYPQFTRKFMTTTLVDALCFLHIIDREFYCQGCHHTWPISDILAAETDLLNWPAKKRGVASQRG